MGEMRKRQQLVAFRDFNQMKFDKLSDIPENKKIKEKFDSNVKYYNRLIEELEKKRK